MTTDKQLQKLKLNPAWMPKGFSYEDLAAVPPEMMWSTKMVEERLIEALKTARYAVKGDGGGASSGWPEYLSDWEDWLAQADSGTLMNRDMKPTMTANKWQVSRMEEALGWQSSYLKATPGPARVLTWYLRSKLHGGSFAALLRRKGLSRATAYRSRDRALSIIAFGLMRDGVKPQ